MGAQASREARRCGERPFPAPVFSDRVRTITLTGKDGNEIPLRVIERPVSLYNCQNLICTSKSLQDLLEHPMPCASWSGFLRLSLVSCPIYLSPATSRTKPLRLHQVWRPAAASEPDVDGSDRDRDERVGQPSTPWLVQPDAAAELIKAAQRRGLRCARTTPERVRRSRNHKSSRDTNTTAASL